MIKLLTGAAVAVLISGSAALAVEGTGSYRIYSDDPGVVLQAPYQTRDSGNVYVGALDETTFGLIVGDAGTNAAVAPRRTSQQYKILDDDRGVVLQAPFQN